MLFRSDLEQRLGPYLDHTQSAIRLELYNRQYVGFIKGGRRYIYGNFFKTEYRATNPASEPVVVCDGGDWFWSVIYSLDSKTFQEMQINGLA